MVVSQFCGELESGTSVGGSNDIVNCKVPASHRYTPHSLALATHFIMHSIQVG